MRTLLSHVRSWITAGHFLPRLGLALTAGAAALTLACATGETTPTTGGGGSGATSAAGGGGAGTGGDGMGGVGTGGDPTSTVSTTTTTTTTTTEDTCGNGVLDENEQCDGNDFGGKTCESLGFGAGSLQCNAFCSIVASGCTPPEDCTNGFDDDEDFLPDCLDPDCMDQPVCLDSCAMPVAITIPTFEFGDTTGRPAVQTSSCSVAAGSELIYQFVAPDTADLSVALYSFDFLDFSLSVRTVCNDPATEIACVNDFGPTFDTEILAVPIVAGQTYYVVVDGTTEFDYGFFNIEIQIPTELDFQCGNNFDDDFDGYLDCDDPGCNCSGGIPGCVVSFYCMGGSSLPGEQCFDTDECAAIGDDPICLTQASGFPGGYCSEFCDLAAPVCSGDAVCIDYGLSVNGLCLDKCNSIADCRPGYECVDQGGGVKVCIIGPENICQDYLDNDADGDFDCGDPNCKVTPACVPGSDAAGQPCTTNTQCFANDTDPVCLSQSQFGMPDGYCSQLCDPATPNDCGAGAICTSSVIFYEGGALCFDTCTVNSDCRPGYTCFNFGLPQKICLF